MSKLYELDSHERPVVSQNSPACLTVKYGLTMEDLAAAKISCQWRSFHGNSYAVVKDSDCLELSQRLKAERAAAATAMAIAEIGAEAYAAKQAAEAAAAERAAAAAAAARTRASGVAEVKKAALALVAVAGSGATLPAAARGGSESKAGAKERYSLTESELQGIHADKVEIEIARVHGFLFISN